MGIKVESWQSNDGKLFKGEEDMLRHEINIALTEEFPNLKVCIPQLMLNVGRITEILEPLAAYYRENHPETAPETTLEPIPPLVFWHEGMDAFVGMTSRRVQTVDFHRDWHHRRHEFPIEPVAEEGTLADG